MAKTAAIVAGAVLACAAVVAGAVWAVVAITDDDDAHDRASAYPTLWSEDGDHDDRRAADGCRGKKCRGSEHRENGFGRDGFGRDGFGKDGCRGGRGFQGGSGAERGRQGGDRQDGGQQSEGLKGQCEMRELRERWEQAKREMRELRERWEQEKREPREPSEPKGKEREEQGSPDKWLEPLEPDGVPPIFRFDVEPWLGDGWHFRWMPRFGDNSDNSPFGRMPRFGDGLPFEVMPWFFGDNSPFGGEGFDREDWSFDGDGLPFGDFPRPFPGPFPGLLGREGWPSPDGDRGGGRFLFGDRDSESGFCISLNGETFCFESGESGGMNEPDEFDGLDEPDELDGLDGLDEFLGEGLDELSDEDLEQLQEILELFDGLGLDGLLDGLFGDLFGELLDEWELEELPQDEQPQGDQPLEEPSAEDTSARA